MSPPTSGVKWKQLHELLKKKTQPPFCFSKNKFHVEDGCPFLEKANLILVEDEIKAQALLAAFAAKFPKSGNKPAGWVMQVAEMVVMVVPLEGTVLVVGMPQEARVEQCLVNIPLFLHNNLTLCTTNSLLWLTMLSMNTLIMMRLSLTIPMGLKLIQIFYSRRQ